VKLPASLLRDAAGIVGAALIAYGAGLVYRPAGFIVAGVLLVGGAYLAARGGDGGA
jgi:hypothetical protein